MTYLGRRAVEYQRSVDPSTRRGVSKKGTAVLNWITHYSQRPVVNPRFILRLTEDVIMSHQGVRIESRGL